MRALFVVLPLFLVPLSGGLGCGSKLPRNLTDKAPGGQAEPLALDLVEFDDVRTGVRVNLEQYMDANKRDFMLMTFGSKGCGACNEKARHLTSDVIGKHPLYITEPGQRFEIVGVNTDPDPDKLGFYLDQFPYIQWSDPSGDEMLKFFMPPGHKFMVPLTVMISRRGIEWRVMPEETVTVDQIMAKVEYTLGLRDAPPTDDGGGSDGGDDGDDGDDDGGDDGVPGGLLGEMVPGRLKGVTVTGCDGAATTLGDVVGNTDLRVVQVVKGACGATCEANMDELATLGASCAADGIECSTATVITDAPTRAMCDRGVLGKGGDDFFTAFLPLFDWTYDRVLDPDTAMAKMTRGIEGPLVMGFAKDGTIVFTKEGALTRGEIDAARRAPDFAKGARAADFSLYDQTNDVYGLADVRRKSTYTVVNVFGFMCSSCIKELVHWAEPGQLNDYCAAKPEACQTLAVETGVLPDGQSLAQYHQSLLAGSADFAGFGPLGIRTPLALDALPKFNGDGTDNLARFFEGYLVAITPDPDWWSDPRTVIYDREGKIVGQFRSEDPVPGEDDPVLKRIKELTEQ